MNILIEVNIGDFVQNASQSFIIKLLSLVKIIPTKIINKAMNIQYYFVFKYVISLLSNKY